MRLEEDEPPLMPKVMPFGRGSEMPRSRFGKCRLVLRGSDDFFADSLRR